MSAETLLSRLQKVRRSAPGEWLACCPAHEDRSPSLAVKQSDDGRVLVKCFAGCSFEEICTAAGVDMSEMFPEKVQMKGESVPRLPFSPTTCLKAMAFNASILSIVAGDLADGRPVSMEDRTTVHKIREELEEVVRYAAR